MSFQVYPYIVDWEEFSRRWRQGKKPTRGSPHWFCQATEDLETWVVRYAPKHWISSWNAAVDAGLFYDNARVVLKPELRKKMDKLLRPFLGTGTSKTYRRHVRDLTGGDTEEGLFEITMSPAKVAEFCSKADFDWVEKLRPLWAEHNEMDFDPDFTHMKNFGCFKRYMGQWQKLLQTAVRKKKGLVISIV